MDLVRISRYACLYGLYYFNRIARTGPFGCRGAEYLEGPAPVAGNALKTALVRHYVRQYNDAACSVASVVAAVNAL